MAKEWDSLAFSSPARLNCEILKWFLTISGLKDILNAVSCNIELIAFKKLGRSLTLMS